MTGTILQLPTFRGNEYSPPEMRRLVEEIERLNRALNANDPFTQTAIHLLKDATQDVGGANGTVTYISWDDDVVPLKDPGFTHEDTTNPTRIQVDLTGRYKVYFAIGATQAGAARTTLMTHLRVDGSTTYLRGRARNYSRGAIYGDASVQHETELDLIAGEYVECGITVDDTDGVYVLNTINAECEVIIRRLS